MICEILTAVNIMNMVFWDATSCEIRGKQSDTGAGLSSNFLQASLLLCSISPTKIFDSTDVAAHPQLLTWEVVSSVTLTWLVTSKEPKKYTSNLTYIAI
jgi:hypothetical protein